MSNRRTLPIPPITPQPRPAVSGLVCPWCGQLSQWRATQQIRPETPPDGTEPTEEQRAAMLAGDRVILHLTCITGHSWQLAYVQQPGQPAVQLMLDAAGLVLDMAELEAARARTAALSRIIVPGRVQ